MKMYNIMHLLTAVSKGMPFSLIVAQSTEVHFASFLSCGFTTMAVINPLERKLAKRTSVQSTECRFLNKKVI